MAPSITPFFFEEPLVLGDQVTLQCNVVRGDSPITLTWIFHGSDSDAKTRTHAEVRTMKVGEKTNILTISSVTPEHIGSYTCTARSGSSNLSTNYTAVLKNVMGITRIRDVLLTLGNVSAY